MSGGLVMHSASQMRLPDSASASSSSYPQEGEGQRINSELWHACAGPLVSIPTIGSRVVYFPQGHSEQVAALTQKQVDAPIPNYPNLPAHLMCHLHHATLHADIETDEVYAQLTLQPISNQEKEPFLVSDLGTQSQQPANFFCKTLTPSDTSTHGGFSIPRRAADKVFPPLDYTQQPPAQELIAKDLHNNEWKFRHIYRGQPKRHLLTTGWSVFVSAKRLTAGDSVLFIRNEKGELLLGIRHANRVQNAMPSSVLSSDSMHIGILAAAAHAAATNSCFTVFYNPRASPSEFVISLCKYEKAIYHTRVSVGMRFRMLFETEESSVRRYMGTITGISDSDPVRWPSSHWRSMKVGWDESMAVERPKRVSLWEIEPITTFLYPPVSNWRLKYPWPQTLTSPITTGGVGINNSKGPLMWTRGQTMDGVFQGLTNPWAPSIQGMLNTGGPLIRPEFYNAMGMVAETRVNDPLRQLSPFQSPPQQMLPYATQVQSQSPVQYPHQAHMPHPSMYSNMQNETPQQVQQNSPISPPSVAPISSSPMPSHSQQTNIVAEPVCAMPTPGVHHPLQSILSGLVGEDRGSPSSMLPSTQILEQRHDSHAVSDSWFPPLNMITMQSNFSEVAWSSSFAPNDQTLLSTSSNPYSLRDYSQDQASLQTDVASHLLFQGHDSIGTTDLPLSSGMLMDDESLLQHAEALTQVQPPTRTFTKVYKVGSVGRSLDVTRFNNYSELRLELGRMFNLEGKLEEPQRSGWQLVFIDKENDALLLGDDPWERDSFSPEARRR